MLTEEPTAKLSSIDETAEFLTVNRSTYITVVM